jgi:tyrosinase
VGEPVEVTVPVDEASVQELMTSPVGEEIQRRAFVEIDDIEAEHAPDLVYGVYVNLPSNPSDAELASDHVGNLPFFGIELSQTPVSDRHAHGLHVTLEITGLLDSQVATGRWQNPNEISVAFRPLTLEAPPDHPEIADEIASPTHLDNPVTIGRVSLRLA